MSDFAQQGQICTLQRLTGSSPQTLGAQLAKTVKTTPIALVLPCGPDDFEKPAFGHILDEIARAEFLSEVVVSMNGVDAAGAVRAGEMLACLPQRARLIWNDGPKLTALYRRENFPCSGKGGNVWSAMGLLLSEKIAAVIATQDCDVVSFRRETLARLCCAVADPRLGYGFAKMYYSRVAERIYGRASRLFLAPFLQALVRVAGHHPLLDFLLSFRYPLAGESALAKDLAAEATFAPGWDLEIGMLCEMFRLTPPRNVCQVDGGSDYDHKHQPLADARGNGLVAMTRSIARALLRELAKEGLVIDAGFLDATKSAYVREGVEAIRRSRHLALINGLPFDEATEARATEAFASGLEDAIREPADRTPALPAWGRLLKTRPDFVEEFQEAITADQAAIRISHQGARSS